jgi:hypothetical protein
MHGLLVLVVVLPSLLAAWPAPVVAAGSPLGAETPTATDAVAALPLAPGTDEPLAAYLRTVDLDDDERMAVISAEPVNYLAANGEWLPIRPVFTPEIDGFANRTNALAIHTAARQPVVEVMHGDLAARWTPLALTLEQGDHMIALAEPQTPDRALDGVLSPDGATVRYTGSWSLPTLYDEVSAGAGAVEHNVVFSAAPNLDGQEPDPDAKLVLAAKLTLPPGAQLIADGVVQTAAFTTTSTLELRDYANTTRLELPPAHVFEQAAPGIGLFAVYHVVPVDARTWQVRMETPWSWWADPARRYPVVWDPLMQVLRALQVAQIASSNACDPYFGSAPHLTGIGRLLCPSGVNQFTFTSVRTLLRFSNVNQLNLPPGSELQGAILLAAPTDAVVNQVGGSIYNTCVNTQLHRVTGGWDHNSVNWGNQPSVDNAPYQSSSTSYAGRTDPPLCFYPVTYQYSGYSGTKWLVQNGASGVVSDWLAGGANNGLELRARPDLEGGCPNGQCQFVRIPKQGVWSPSDRDQSFGNDFELMKSGGFMLIVRYRGPALPNNTPYSYTPGSIPIPPKPNDENFHRTRHVYRLPASTGSPWLVVGAKGFRKNVIFYDVQKQGLFSYAYWTQRLGDAAVAEVQDATTSSYAFPLAVAPESCTTAACETRSEGGNAAGSNFILMSAGNVAGRDMRIDPLPPNAKLEQYAMEASWSTQLDPDPITTEDVGDNGVRRVYTVTVDSGHIVQAYHLALPENVRMSLSTQVVVPGLSVPTASAITHLYPPGNGLFPKTQNHKVINSGETVRTYVPPGLGGDHAVVLELPGDKTAFDRCSGNVDSSTYCYLTPGPPGNEPADREPKDRTLQVVLTLQVCPVNGIPTDTGCALVVKPDWSQTNLWRAVGPYRVWSPSGFQDCIGTANAECSRRYVGEIGKSTEYASVITWGERFERAVVVAGVYDPFNYNRIVSFRKPESGLELYLNAGGIIHLGRDPDGYFLPLLEISVGGLSAGYQSPVTLDSGVLSGGFCSKGFCNGLALSDYDLDNYYARQTPVSSTQPELRIVMPQSADDSISQYAEFTARIMRPQKTDSGVENQLLEVKWQVRAEGYAGWAESPGGDGPRNASATALSTIDGIKIAGLTYYVQGGSAWVPYYDPAAGYFTKFRNENGKIFQSANLGGAWSYVDYVILPYGVAPGGGSGLTICPNFCGEARAPDDTFASPKPDWKMPDVLVNQLPNTIMVSSPGALQVYSTDHPTSLASTNDTYGFSFKTFGAKVEIITDVCPGGGSTPVPIIRGTTLISLPGMDSRENPAKEASAVPSIEAQFTLCEDALRQVKLTFKYPPGIPVAAPPVMYVDMIGGTVTIGPANVVINIDVGFYIGAATPKVFKGVATLTLDTRGLFDLQATGRVMGIMDGEGHLWVAWNPLDLGVGAQAWLPNKKDWVLSGFIYAHVWRGSGWQNKYPWLAGNDDFHLTASYQVTFRIEEGAVVDEWPFVLPPGEIRIGVELSFGQFCANDGCTDYEWGIKGKIEILGFDVGAYINLECEPLLAALVFPPAVLLCTSFILGSDDHILIDQYGGNGPPFPLTAETPVEEAAEDGAPPGNVVIAQMERRAVADPAAAEVDEALPPVTGATASFLVMFGWVRGMPNFALVKPDGTSITAANAASQGVAFSRTANSLIFGVSDPAQGVWKARITNATIQDDYRVLYFANKATPGVTFTAPTGTVDREAAGGGNTSEFYKITWTPPADAANLRMSLFYSATVPNAPSPTYQYGGVIRENIDPATGFFDWDTTYLARGEYRIYATIQDKAGAQVSELGENQYVGVTTSVAPGVLRYADDKGPAPLNPGSVVFTPLEDGVLMCWDVSPAHDLADYYITYRVVDSVYLSGRNITERVHATVPYAAGPPVSRQCLPIGGLVAGDSVVDFPTTSHGIAAADASDNIGGFVQPGFTTVPGGATHRGPAAPVLTGQALGGGAVKLSWPPLPNEKQWDLYYAREAYAGPHAPGSGAAEGDSPISINELDFGGDYTLTGLARGYWYSFAVRAYGRNSLSPPSSLSNWVWLLVSDGVDSNGDGCPDDWIAAHGNLSPSSNPDQDGLTTLQECKIGTNPRDPNTDGDWPTDGQEVAAGTNPLDPNSFPPLTPADAKTSQAPATLALATRELSFYAFTQGPNPPSQTVGVSNAGGGSLTPTVSANRPWLKPAVVNGQVVVGIDKSGLALGEYTGRVTVGAQPAGTHATPQSIDVTLQIFAGDDPRGSGGGTLYMPRLGR